MSGNLPARRTGNPAPDIQRQAARHDLPLGTAGWHQFGFGETPRCDSGDFFLSRLPTGEPVGIRDDRHVLVCAGTRAGKGISIIIPNLGFWPGSVVVIDPKGENAIVTARRRGRGSDWSHGLGQDVRILDPFDEVRGPHDEFADLKACFNPLDGLSPEREESVDEAARIADALVVGDTASNEPFWEEAARSLLKSIILHVVSWKNYGPDERNLIKVRSLVMAGDAELRRLLKGNCAEHDKVPSGFALLFDAMSRNKAFGGVVSDAGEQYARMEATSPRVLASIAQVACTNTDFIDSPAMRRSLARSSFELSALKTAKAGMSLYLCLPQRFMGTHHRWLRLIATLTITEMERIRHQPESGHPVLMVLDEFAALGRLKIIEHAAAQIAGFGVKMMFVVQTLAQLKDVYKDNWETLLANSGIKLFFGNDDHFTREYVSKLIGNCEVARTAESHSATEGHSWSQTEGTTTGLSESRAFGSSSSYSYGEGRMGFTSGTNNSRTYTQSESWSSSSTRSESQSRTKGQTESIHQRALVTPDEVGRLFGDRENPRALALVSGMQPLLLRRISYFADRRFDGWYDPHPDHPLPPTLVRRSELAAMATWFEKERQSARAMQQALIEAMKQQRQAEAKAQQQAIERERAKKARRRKLLRAAGGVLTIMIQGSTIGIILTVAIWYFGLTPKVAAMVFAIRAWLGW